MEKWQREHIIENLCDLIANIDCNVYLVSYLRQFGVLSEADEDKLKTVGKSEGDGEKKNTLLKMLMTRKNGYEYLANGLFQCRQTGAILKLLEGYTINLPGASPFELCKIELDVEQILTKYVIFGGIILPLKNVCKDIKPELLRSLITSGMDVTSYEKIISEKPIELTVDTIPKSIPYYIPRTLFIKNQLDPKIFDALETDIFCIEGIELYQLSALSKIQAGCITDKSRNQIHEVTARFILLEHHDHFKQIAKRIENSVHWIRHEKNNFFYVRGGGRIIIQSIQPFLIQSNSQYLSEDEFLSKCQNGPPNAAVLLYDSPGMGKSVLLARLAQKTKENRPNSSVIFLHISELISKVRQVQQEISSVAIKQALLEIMSRSSFSQNIIKTLLDSRNHQTELFLDAFDELPGYDFTFANNILNVIAKECNNIRIYLTTRRHRRDELEGKFGTLGYNIQPFDDSNKLSFFLKFWETEHGLGITDERKEFAENAFKTVFNEMDVDIAGIPFQCRMMADIYAGDAKRGGIFPKESQYRLNSIFHVYKHFIDTKFSTFCRDVDKQMYYNFHVQQSLVTLFPDKSNLFGEECGVPKDEIIYRIGILEPPKSDSSIPEFSHRTLAEYFTADYLASSVTSKLPKDLIESDFIDLFLEQSLLYCENDRKEVSFENPAICRFLNFFLSPLHSEGKGSILALKTALRESCSYNSETLLGILESSLRINAIHLYLFLLDVYLDLEEPTNNPTSLYIFKETKVKETERLKLVTDLKEDKKLPELVAIAANHSSLNLVRLSCQLLEIVTGEHVHEISYYQEPMYYALSRGHYQIFEYLLSFDREGFYTKPLLHWCLEDSYGRNFEDKVQILKRILHERPNLLNQPHPDYKNIVPLLVHNPDFSLIKILIEAGAELTQTNEDNENIVHTSWHFSSEEYHKLVQLIISHNEKMLFTQRDKWGCTPVERALQRIDLKRETLELLAETCNVRFNNKELAIAIDFERSSRVIKDIVRLGGDQEKLDRETREKLFKNYNM